MQSVHLIDEQIAEAIAGAANTDVRLGAIRGSWMYLDPRLSIEDLQIGDEQSTGVLIRNMSVRLNTVASIIERSIVIDEIEVDGFQLNLIQASDGTWQVEGLPVSDKPVDLAFLLDSFAHINYISARNLNITVQGVRERLVIRNRADERFTLVAEDDDKRFRMPLEVESTNKNRKLDDLDLIGLFEGDPREPETIVTRLYLKVPSIEYLDLIPDVQLGSIKLTESNIEGEFWLSVSADEVELLGILADGSIQATNKTGSTQVVENLRSEFILKGGSLDHLQLFIRSFDAEFGGRQWSLSGTSIAISGTHAYRQLAVHLPSLQIGNLVATASTFGNDSGLFDDSTKALLVGLNPAGELLDIQLTMNLETGFSSFLVSANLKDIRINPYHGIPGISSLNGFVLASATDGYLDLNNTEPFSLDFAAMFPEAWTFDNAHARLNYQIQGDTPETRVVRISSELVRVTDGDLSASGRLQLNLPPERENQTWGLEVGLTDGDLKDVGRYLPKVLPQQVQDWLNRALVSGQADEGGMVFHGSLYRGEPRNRKLHELYFKTSNTAFDYDPNWPRVNDLNTTVFIGYNSIHSDGIVGRVVDSKVTSGSFRVPVYPDGSTDSILINGKFSGTVPGGIYMLNNTPIADATKNMAETWLGEGLLTGDISLDFPIGKRAGQEVNVEVEVDLLDSRLSMPLFNLEIEALNGIVKYETVPGLSSAGFTGRIFNEPVSGAISTKANDGRGEIEVAVEGAVSTPDLYEWSNQVLITQLDGLLAYDAKVHIPVGQESAPIWVEATSDLSGVAVDLPPPMRKSADERAYLSYVQTFLATGDRVDVKYAEDVVATLKIVNSELSGGRVHFGADPLGVVTFDKIGVSGKLESVDYSDWEKLIESIQSKSAVSIESELANQLRAIELEIVDLNVFDLELENVKAYITRKEGAWSIGLRNELLSGIVEVSDLETEPLSIVLDYLHFTADELVEGQEPIDPLAGQDPAKLVAIDFKTDELMIGDEHYGMWSFRYRPTNSGGQLEKLSASVRGLQVLDDSTILWTLDDAGQQKSTYKGRVLIPELDQALEQWGYASSIEGENFEFEADVFWAGSPAMVDLLKIDGSVKLHGGKGRFVQADTGAGALKVLGIFDFASLARRFRFDFSDIVDEGFSFNEVSGATRIRAGDIKIIDPIEVKGSSGSFRVGGQVSLVTQQLDSDMIVTLPLSQNLPWYAAYSAIATGPLVGAGVWVAQKVFEKQIDQLSSAKYKVSGTVEEPVIEFVSIFSDSVRDMSEPDSIEETKSEDAVTPQEEHNEMLEGL